MTQMNNLSYRIKRQAVKIFSHRNRLGLGVIIIFLLCLVILIPVFFNVTIQASAKNTIGKLNNQNSIDFESRAAMHSRTHRNQVEDPRFGLGHCDPKVAPREDEIHGAGQQKGEWSPC